MFDRDTLRDRVLARLDEQTPEGSADAVPEEVIDVELRESARDILDLAPASLLAPAIEDWSSVAEARLETLGSSTHVVVEAPRSVYRVLKLLLSHWDRPVDETAMVKERSDTFDALVANDYGGDENKGVTTRKPIAVYGPASVNTFGRPDDDNEPRTPGVALRCWPAPDADPSVDLFRVVEARGTGELPERLQDAALWMACSRIANGFLRHQQLAEHYHRQAEQVLQSRSEADRRMKTLPEHKSTAARPYRPFG